MITNIAGEEAETPADPNLSLIHISEPKRQMQSHDKIILHMLFGSFHITPRNQLDPLADGFKSVFALNWIKIFVHLWCPGMP